MFPPLLTKQPRLLKGPLNYPQQVVCSSFLEATLPRLVADKRNLGPLPSPTPSRSWDLGQIPCTLRLLRCKDTSLTPRTTGPGALSRLAAGPPPVVSFCNLPRREFLSLTRPLRPDCLLTLRTSTPCSKPPRVHGVTANFWSSETCLIIRITWKSLKI